MKIVAPDGRVIDGTRVSFKSTKDDWVEYALSDGTTMKFKLVMRSVIRTNEHQPNGDPIYVFDMTTVVATDAPEELRRLPVARPSSGVEVR